MFTTLVRSDRLAVVEFDDGGMNLLSDPALAALDAEIERLPGEVDALLFRSGRPSIFAAGADMAAMERFDGAAAGTFAERGVNLFRRIESLPFVTAVAIDGDCFGGAVDLALAFDFRFATKSARFSHPGSRIGIVTGFGGTYRWRRTMSRGMALRLLGGNGVMSADEAANAGLIDAVVESPGEIEARVAPMRRLAGARIRLLRDLFEHGGGLPLPRLRWLSEQLHALYSHDG